MKIQNKKLLAEFRKAGTCERCFTPCRKRVAHHIKPKGAGGGSTMDIRINLVSLGTPWDCHCHSEFHDKNQWQEDFLDAVARRERCLRVDLEAVLTLFSRLAKPSPAELAKEVGKLNETARKLAKRTLTEADIELRESA